VKAAEWAKEETAYLHSALLFHFGMRKNKFQKSGKFLSASKSTSNHHGLPPHSTRFLPSKPRSKPTFFPKPHSKTPAKKRKTPTKVTSPGFFF